MHLADGKRLEDELLKGAGAQCGKLKNGKKFLT